MKVSIVMPVLNGMPYMQVALKSVREQTLQDIEILVVDAGSTDGTLEFIAEQSNSDSRIKLIRSEQKSMGHQYNLGIQNSTGTYIGFCESDDYLEADMMEKLYTIAVSEKYPEIIKSDFYLFVGAGESEVSLIKGILPRNQVKLYEHIISLNDCMELCQRDVNMWNGIYSREFLTKYGIALNETKGAAYQDAGFVFLTLLQAKRMVYTKQAFYHYRKDNEGSSVYKVGAGLFCIQELTYLLNFLSKNKEIWKRYGIAAFERGFQAFCLSYATDLQKVPSVEYEREIIQMKDRIGDLYEKVSKEEQRQLHLIPNLTYFLFETEQFKEKVCSAYGKIVKEREVFESACKAYEEVVIFGCGERGTTVAAFLKKNNYAGKICFCDNNTIMQKTQLLGIPVFSVEKAVQKYGNALYIVFDTPYRKQMEDQLNQKGISKLQIYCAPVITHNQALAMN